MQTFKKYRNLLSKTEWVSGFAFFIIGFALIFGSRTLRLQNTKSIHSNSSKVIYLEQSVGISTLAEKMKAEDIKFNAKELKWAARILGWNRFRSGRYEVDGSYSYDVLLSRLAKGIQDPVKLTILPGITKQKFFGTVSSQVKFDRAELEQVFEDSVFLIEHNVSKETIFGRMLPETYLVYWDINAERLVDRILTEFEDKVIKKHKNRIEELQLNLSEIITLASIVEWEANEETEKDKIAGLYWNRLKSGMKLQADPTVNYAVGERRRLLFEDLKIDHPYNTYLIKGLPPGPITNPSLSTIVATLYPENHDYLYMVASPDGTHEFNRSYSEHLEATKRWRKWLQKQYQIKKQREADKAEAS